MPVQLPLYQLKSELDRLPYLVDSFSHSSNSILFPMIRLPVGLRAKYRESICRPGRILWRLQSDSEN